MPDVGPRQLVWGTTFKVLVQCSQAGAPIDITGHRMIFTLKQRLADADPGIAQFDNLGMGATFGTIVFLVQSGATLGQAVLTMFDSATRAIANPVAGPIPLFAILLDNDGLTDVWPLNNEVIQLLPNVSTTRP